MSPPLAAWSELRASSVTSHLYRSSGECASGAGVPIHCGISRGTRHHKTDGGRGVPVGRRRLVRTKVLDRAPERGTGEGKPVQARVRESEHSPVSAPLQRDDLTGTLGKRQDLVPL